MEKHERYIRRRKSLNNTLFSGFDAYSKGLCVEHQGFIWCSTQTNALLIRLVCGGSRQERWIATRYIVLAHVCLVDAQD